jgi:hypothetical protein
VLVVLQHSSDIATAGDRRMQRSLAALRGHAAESAGGARRPTARLHYYARLVVNGRVVGASAAAPLGDDFRVGWRDVFR